MAAVQEANETLDTLVLDFAREEVIYEGKWLHLIKCLSYAQRTIISDKSCLLCPGISQVNSEISWK